MIVPDSPAADALKELDAWDELGFHKAHAALVLEFPNQAEFVFKDLAPRSGNDAILGVVQFLDRLDILEKGERAATKDDDKRAIDELTKRGIGPDERARLRRLVAVAHSSPEILLDAPSEASFQEQRMRTLTALYYWYERWVEVARVVVKQRNDTIMLGIAKRRAKKGSDAVTASDTVPGDVQRPAAMDGVTAGSNARVA